MFDSSFNAAEWCMVLKTFVTQSMGTSIGTPATPAWKRLEISRTLKMQVKDQCSSKIKIHILSSISSIKRSWSHKFSFRISAAVSWMPKRNTLTYSTKTMNKHPESYKHWPSLAWIHYLTFKIHGLSEACKGPSLCFPRRSGWLAQGDTSGLLHGEAVWHVWQCGSGLIPGHSGARCNWTPTFQPGTAAANGPCEL